MALSAFGSIVLILVSGVAIQWVAWRTRAPAILLLLVTGVVVGPVLGWLAPDAVFGRDLIRSFASIAVAIILFEGGLSLKKFEIRETGTVILLLVTVGFIVSWVVASAGAALFAGFDYRVAMLWGALMAVSGPTVILPLLAQVRPATRVRTILKWEAIIIDPIGAVLAATVFEIFFAAHQPGWTAVATQLIGLFGSGILIGLIGAAISVLALHRFWVPDFLHAPVMLALAVGTYALSESIYEQSGLLTVAVMGAVVSNQKIVDVEHILEFKETLRTLLISSLFIILAARIKLELLSDLRWNFLLLVGALVLVARPLAVVISTVRSPLTARERLFLAGVMPRGIIAVAVAALFTLRVESLNLPGSSQFAAYSILTVVATVVLYGPGAEILSKKLGLSDANPQGLLVFGANDVGMHIAKMAKDLGFRAVVIDRDAAKIDRATSAGLEAVEADALDARLAVELDLQGIGQFVAATPNDDVNELAVLSWTPYFGRNRVFRMAQDPERYAGRSGHGQPFGASLWTFSMLSRELDSGGQMKIIAGASPQGLDTSGGLMIRSADGSRLRLLTPSSPRTCAEGETIWVIRGSDGR